MDASLLQKTPFYDGIKDKEMLEEFAKLFHRRDCDAELKDGMKSTLLNFLCHHLLILILNHRPLVAD